MIFLQIIQPKIFDMKIFDWNFQVTYQQEYYQ